MQQCCIAGLCVPLSLKLPITSLTQLLCQVFCTGIAIASLHPRSLVPGKINQFVQLQFFRWI